MAADGFRALESEKDQPYFRLAGAEGLHALRDPGALQTLVGLLALREHATQNLIPSYLLGVGPDQRTAVGAALVAGLDAEEPLEREVSAWLAGDGGFGETVPALRGARTEGTPEVGVAATWALERLQPRGMQ